MNESTAFHSMILRRFFDRFQSVAYQGVPICKHYYYQFLYYAMCRWNSAWAKQNLPYWEDELSRLSEFGVYSWSDEPYEFDRRPGGLILMRGGFGDIASLYLPADRFMLLSPNQAEVDIIKTNRPDLAAYNIEDYYRENPPAVEALNRQIAQIIAGQKDDPILGSPDLLQWFQSCTPGIVRLLSAIQSLFEKHQISAVLTISSICEMDSALNLVARSNRIPSFTLQHGLTFDRDLFCHIPILAAKKLVWGNMTLEWYKKYGFPESRITVVGSPRFDIIFNRKWCGKEKLRQMLAIDPAKKVVIYATGTDMNTIVPIVLDGLKSIPDLFLVLLLHPTESSIVARYQQLAEGYPDCKVVRFGHISLYDGLSGADFFITHYSTAALEAMFFKIPVITVEPSPPPFSFGDLGASLRVTDAAGLNQVANRLLSDNDFRANAVNQYREFIAQYCIPDGLAAQRLFDEIERVCGNGE